MPFDPVLSNILADEDPGEANRASPDPPDAAGKGFRLCEMGSQTNSAGTIILGPFRRPVHAGTGSESRSGTTFGTARPQIATLRRKRSKEDDRA